MRRAARWVLLGGLATGCGDGAGGDGDNDTEATGTTAGDGTMTTSPGDASQGPGGPGGPDDTTATEGPVDTTADATTPGDTTATGDDVVDATTGPDESDDDVPVDCEDDGDCSGATPFCVTGLCAGCMDFVDPDAQCINADPAAPICTDAGCVQCLAGRTDACGGTSPICDTDTSQCVGCTYHAQCEPACNLETGACMPVAPTFHVRPQVPTCSVLNAGTFDNPFCLLDEAIAAIQSAGGLGTIVLDETPAASPHQGMTVPGGVTIAIVPQNANEHPVIGASPIYIEAANSRVYLEGARITGLNVFDVIRIGNSIVWFDRVDVVANFGYAIDMSPGGTLHLRNSIVGSNSRPSNIRAPLWIDDATVDMVYTTIAGNFANNANTVDSIACINGGSVTARNSVVVARDGVSIDCPGIDVSYSYLDTPGLGGAGNVVQIFPGDELLNWFVDPSAPGPYYGEDYHLTAAGAALFGPVGLTQAGDLPFDFDLDPRPIAAGSPTTAGADEP